ncbi:hypothetical protein BJ170DRAFT_682056 [Xylariales sp. AK1849]|nr:hypothetical protein BJ170DRAFT_682056 [Xylariales sp. AK1849]
MATDINMDSTNAGLVQDRPETYDNEKAVIFVERRSSRRSIVFQIVIYLLAAWAFVSLWLQVYQSVSSSSSFPTTNKPTSNSLSSTFLDVYHPETLPDGMTLCGCGSTTEEARSRSCVYDTLATAWLPPFCRDAELTEEFDKSGDGPNGTWSYFTDANGMHPLSVGALGALGDTGERFWASRRWHRAHCVFYWQKLYRMRETGRVMEERFHRWSHVLHCSRLLLNPSVDLDALVDVPVTLNSSVYAGRKDVDLH